jgi:small subunit ribosomal protein S7
MSRRRRAEKREVLPDPKFGDLIVTKFMNYVMYEGKKAVAENIIYGAFDILEAKRRDQGPLETFHSALDNVAPAVEVRSRRVGGATYQVPVEVRPDRRRALAIRWLVTAARKRGENTMTEKLAGELLDASNNRGTAVKKREDTHKMAAPYVRPLARPEIRLSRRAARNAPHSQNRRLPQLRHHGPHRCREDHDHGADSLLHRQEPQDR